MSNISAITFAQLKEQIKKEKKKEVNGDDR